MTKYFVDISSSLENLSSYLEHLAKINQMMQEDLPQETIEIAAFYSFTMPANGVQFKCYLQTCFRMKTREYFKIYK